MAPLAFVFLARESSGGYGLGAVLAAAYTLAEAAGAPVLGSRLTNHRMRLELVVGIGVSALALAGLAIGAPIALTVTFAVVAGATAAAAPGGLRTVATRIVGESDVPAVLSLEAVLNQTVWAAAPALVSVLALAVAPSAPFVVARRCRGGGDCAGVSAPGRRARGAAAKRPTVRWPEPCGPPGRST